MCASQSLVVDLSLQTSIQHVFGAQRKNVAEFSIGFNEALVVEGAKQILALSRFPWPSVVSIFPMRRMA